MPPDGQEQLSQQDVQDLQEIRKRMPAGDARGAKIDTLLQSAAPAKPTTADNPIEKQASNEGFFTKVFRGGALGTAEGAGIPETQTPVRDLFKGVGRFAKNVGSLLSPGFNITDKMQAADELYTQPRKQAVDTANADISRFGNESAWAERGLAEVPLIGPGLVKAASSTSRGFADKDPEEAAHGIASGMTQAAMLGAGSKGGQALTETVMDNTVRRVTTPVFNAAKEVMGTRLSDTAAVTPRPAGQFQPALNNAPKEVLEHAAQEGIQITPAQATEGPTLRNIQAAGERGIGGGKPLTEALEANRTKFGEAVNRLGERVDKQRTGLSEEQAGETIRQAVETAKDVAHTNATDAYKKLSWANKTPVEAGQISKTWGGLRDSLPMGVEDQILSQVPRNMRAQVEEMLSPTGMKAPLTFEQGINLRSFFREMGEAEGLPNRLQGAYRTMTKATDAAMESAAKKAGFESEWRDANAGWKDYAAKYGDKQSPLYKVLHQSDPAKITRALMNNASARDIEMLAKEGMDLAPLRRQVIQDIARNKFTVGRDGLGGYSDSFLHTLFGPDGTHELYLKADISRRLNWDPNPPNTSGPILASEQLDKPWRVANLMAAAKSSMPRDALSYLPGRGASPSRLNINPGIAAQWMRAANQKQLNP